MHFMEPHLRNIPKVNPFDDFESAEKGGQKKEDGQNRGPRPILIPRLGLLMAFLSRNRRVRRFALHQSYRSAKNTPSISRRGEERRICLSGGAILYSGGGPIPKPQTCYDLFRYNPLKAAWFTPVARAGAGWCARQFA